MNHPDIENTIRTGYPHGEPEYPVCPVCGYECDEIYMDMDEEIFGCSECIKKKSAWECKECFKEE